MSDYASLIRDVPDFPKPGIVFKDITPLLADHRAMREVISGLVKPFESAGIEVVAGIEARGFIFAALAADRLGAGMVPIRKMGKLPSRTITLTYQLEYGTDSIQMHADAFKPGAKVLVVDDLLATGGTLGAACQLVDKLGGKVAGVACVIELEFLAGRQKLPGRNVHSLIKFA